DATRIDAVLNLVGELVIGKSMLHQTMTEFDKAFPKNALKGRFADAMAFQARIINDLQKSVMKIRMVPVEQLFRRFPRLVRDVAMDVVRTVLGRLKGAVDIKSEPGKGTTFYLRVPLTLAIIKALLFRVGQRMYAVPLASVLEITRASQSEVHVVDQHHVIHL